MMHLDHPRFFAFVPSPGNFVSVMADALVSGFNVFAGTWMEASGPAMIELQTLEWLRQICSLPETAGGLFTSGGSMANLTALAVARHVKLGAPRPDGIVYCSDQAHSSITRALRVLGFQPNQLRVLPSDRDYRLDVIHLRDAVAGDRAIGLQPFCVVANAGTTNCGAIDPLHQIADFCRAQNLWFHIDGAYGAAAAFCPRGKKLLSGIEYADSLTIDPHKWLFQPYEIGCLLVRREGWLNEVFHILPEYLADIETKQGEVNFCDRGVQLTRSFRALKLWLSLQVYGAQAFSRAIEHGFEMAEHAEVILHSMPNWSVFTPAHMGVITFSHTKWENEQCRLEKLHHRLVQELIADGTAFFSTTSLGGHSVMRMCTINPRTSRDDIEVSLYKLDQLIESAN
jgi:glutamate/tyrosine decarboxylase-like PLP-dependent enzyme